MSTQEAPYQRILLKVSGEALQGTKDHGIDRAMVDRIAGEIHALHQQDIKIGVALGGGNLFRGADVQISEANRVSGHHMGMLAIVMNALVMQDALSVLGVKARVMSALAIPRVCEEFNQQIARTAFENGEVIIFAAGIGVPYVTSDTGTAVRALEMDCEAIFKATNVDGVYSADPRKDPNAIRYDQISHEDVIAQGLQVMDTAAVALARQGNIPVIIFSLHEPGSIVEVVNGRGRSTIVS